MVRFVLFALVLSGFALAQTPDLPTGIPAEYQPVVTVLIGLVTALLVQPLTALAKKLGRTQGVTTVAISGTLSVLIALGFMFAQAAATRQEQNLWAALLVALVAFVKANGDYLTRVFATAKGGELAPPGLPAQTPPDVVPPAPSRQSGLEDIR